MAKVNGREKTQCSARSKRTGERCKRWVLPGKKVCKWHGGASDGAKKGNKNAVTTGQYESIFPGCMDNTELMQMECMDTTPLKVLDEEIRLTRVRETRILQRIKITKNKEDLAGKPTGETNSNGKPNLHPSTQLVSASRSSGDKGNSYTLNEEAHAQQLLKLENALTAVQGHLTRLLERKAEYLLQHNEDRDSGGVAYNGLPAHLIGPAHMQFVHDVRENSFVHYWHKGGRGSLKSSTIALALVDDLVRNPDSHAVVMRNVFGTIKDSVYSQILWAIDRLGLADQFVAGKSPLEITYIPTGQKILFRGLDNPLKLKSIKLPFGYIRNVWFEEVAEMAGMETVRNVLQSLLRGGDIFHVFYSYNPPKSRLSWVNTAVELEKIRPDTVVYHTDYRTVPTSWLGEVFLAQAEHLKTANETAYHHEYLGEVVGTGGAVFGSVVLEELPADFSCQVERFGIDFGFATDPFVWIRCGYDRLYDTLYIYDEIYQVQLHDDQAAKMISKRGKQRQATYCDCADPKGISNMQRQGVAAYACKKFPGSREHGYNWLQRWAKIVIDPRRCPNAAREFPACEYVKNKDGEFVAAIAKLNDHTIDAVRYACDREIADARTATSTYVSMA